MSGQGAIRIVDAAGNPVTNAAAGGEIVVEMILSGDAEGPVEVEVSASNDTETVVLRPAWSAGGLTVYRSDPVVLYDATKGQQDVGLWFDSGETLQVQYGTTAAQVVAYDTTAEANLANCREELARVKTDWVAAIDELLRIRPRTPEVQAAVDRARRWLRFLIWATDEMAQDDELPGRSAYIAARILEKVPSDPYATITGHAIPHDTRDYTYWPGEWRRQYRDELHDAFTDMMATITIGSYREFTQQTGTAQAWTVLTGTNEMGQEASRLAAAGELALDLVVGKVAQGAIRRATGGGSSTLAPKPEPRTNPRQRVAKPGKSNKATDLDGDAVDYTDYGIRTESMRVFRSVADQAGVTFVIRPANVESMRWQALDCPVKGTEIKVKTLNEVDFHLGAPRKPPRDLGPDDAAGLVWAGQPTLPWRPPHVTDAQWSFINEFGTVRPPHLDDGTWDAMRLAHGDATRHLLGDYRPPGIPPEIAAKLPNRFVQRQHEWGDNALDLAKKQDAGLIRVEDGFLIDTGLYGGTGKPITGDIDHFIILDRDGNPLPLHQARKIYDLLKERAGSHTVHGGHLYWPDEFPFKGLHEKKIYENIVKGHETEALIFVGGRTAGPPRAGHARDGAVPVTKGEGPLAGGTAPDFGPAKADPRVRWPALPVGLTAAQIARIIRRWAAGEDAEAAVAELLNDPAFTGRVPDADISIDDLDPGAADRYAELDAIPEDAEPDIYTPDHTETPGGTEPTGTTDEAADDISIDDLDPGAADRYAELDAIPEDAEPDIYVPEPAGAGAGGSSLPWVAGGIAATVLAVVALVVVMSGGGDTNTPAAAMTDEPVATAAATETPADPDPTETAEGAAVPESPGAALDQSDVDPAFAETPDRHFDPLDATTYGYHLVGYGRTDLPGGEIVDAELARVAASGFVTGALQEWERPAGEQTDRLAIVVGDFGNEAAAAAELQAVLGLLRNNEGAAEFSVDIPGAVGTTFPREVYICQMNAGCELDSRWTAYDIAFTMERFMVLVSLELTVDVGPDEAIELARSVLD